MKTRHEPKMTTAMLLEMLDGAEETPTVEYLRFAARWAGRYSGRNQWLLWVQRRDATDLHTYRGWLAEGRQVRKGERAIYLLAPHTKDDPERASGANPDGTVIVRVRPIALFDIAQTDETETP